MKHPLARIFSGISIIVSLALVTVDVEKSDRMESPSESDIVNATVSTAMPK